MLKVHTLGFWQPTNVPVILPATFSNVQIQGKWLGVWLGDQLHWEVHRFFSQDAAGEGSLALSRGVCSDEQNTQELYFLPFFFLN